jgi:hypothetical protein
MKKQIYPEISLSVYHEDEPYAIRFVKSGWGSPDLYHVIREFGDMDNSEYVGTRSSEQIKMEFGIDVNIQNSSLFKIIRSEPNDQSLGKKLRETINSLTT